MGVGTFDNRLPRPGNINKAVNKMKRSATISPCNNYRYDLYREWDETKKTVMFLMLNPSTADGMTDDNTIRRCIDFAKRWGYGSLYVGNLYAFRSTKPERLLESPNPIGEENVRFIQEMSSQSHIVVCAWGNADIIKRLGKLYPNYNPLKGYTEKLYCLDITGSGQPRHPLYTKGDTVLKSYKPQ